jgi:hypothetical protein
VAFRIAEDYTYSSWEDRGLSLPPETALIGVMHPLYLSYIEREAWQQTLIDYEIIPPFPQMTRTTHTLLDYNVVPQAEGVIFYPRPLKHPARPRSVGLFPLHGWQFRQDTRCYQRRFPQQQLTAQIRYSSHRRRIKLCTFQREQQVVPIQHVAPVIVSETLHFIHGLATTKGG